MNWVSIGLCFCSLLCFGKNAPAAYQLSDPACGEERECALGAHEPSDRAATTLSFSMATYFENLSTNSPHNLGDSCGCVSLAQSLSFFDTFRNDSLISGVYERISSGTTQDSVLAVSPGVQRLGLPGGWEVEDFVDANKQTDFQCHLIDIYNSIHSFSEYRSKIGMWNYQGVLDVLYGTSVLPFTTHSWDDYGASPLDATVQSQLKSIAVSKINSGEPVVIHYTTSSTFGFGAVHSVVGYKVDNQNQIHSHFGWGPSSTDMVFDSDQYITNVGYADWSNIALTHSKNYVISSLKYCGCGLHVYHTLSYQKITVGNPFGNEQTRESDPLYIPSYDMYNHQAICACGYQTVAAHFKYSMSFGNYCDGCGLSTTHYLVVEEPNND